MESGRSFKHNTFLEWLIKAFFKKIKVIYILLKNSYYKLKFQQKNNTKERVFLFFVLLSTLFCLRMCMDICFDLFCVYLCLFILSLFSPVVISGDRHSALGLPNGVTATY